MNIDIFHESKSEFRQNVSAINLGRHNRQIKGVRVEHLASDSNAMSHWAEEPILKSLLDFSRFSETF